MIGGVIAVVWLLVTRMPVPGAARHLPETLQMPEGAQAETVTFAKDLTAVVTTDGRILIFAPDGRLRQEIMLDEVPGQP